MNGRHLNWLLMGSGRLLNVAVTAGATGYMDCTWFFTKLNTLNKYITKIYLVNPNLSILQFFN